MDRAAVSAEVIQSKIIVFIFLMDTKIQLYPPPPRYAAKLSVATLYSICSKSGLMFILK